MNRILIENGFKVLLINRDAYDVDIVNSKFVNERVVSYVCDDDGLLYLLGNGKSHQPTEYVMEIAHKRGELDDYIKVQTNLLVKTLNRLIQRGVQMDCFICTNTLSPTSGTWSQCGNCHYAICDTCMVSQLEHTQFTCANCRVPLSSQIASNLLRLHENGSTLIHIIKHVLHSPIEKDVFGLIARNTPVDEQREFLSKVMVEMRCEMLR